jgi:hypothetical protein
MSDPNGEDKRLTSEIAVLSTDPEKKEDEKPKRNGDGEGKGKGKDVKDEPEMVSSRLASGTL